jgi:hypothetical protein
LRRLGEQRGEGVARERDLFLGGLELLARLGAQALGLAQLDGGVEPGRDALARQREHLLALRERTLQDGALLDRARELHVGARDVDGEQDAGGVGVGDRRALAADRRLELGAVAAEQVELPRAVQLRRRGVADRAGDRRRIEAGRREALARRVERAGQLRSFRGVRRGDAGRGARGARGGDAKRRRAGRRARDQVVEDRIVEAAPPLGGDRSGRRRGSAPSVAGAISAAFALMPLGLAQPASAMTTTDASATITVVIVRATAPAPAPRQLSHAFIRPSSSRRFRRWRPFASACP